MLVRDYYNIDSEQLPLQPNGFLQVLANLTRTGVFTYFEKDEKNGTTRIIRQLRLPDEVFSTESMETLVGLPVTNNHPSEMEINRNNASDYIVGMTSDQPKKVLAPVQGDKEDYIQQKLTLFDDATIKQMVDGGKREMSLGYTCYLEDSSGEWNGQSYDYIQRDIRYNHLSLVDRARGGASCRVLIDGQDKHKLHAVCDGLAIDHKNNGDDLTMKILIIDGVEHKVSEEVYASYMQSKKALVDSEEKIDQAQKEVDKLQASNDDLKEQLEKKNNDSVDDKKIKEAVKNRVKLESQGLKVLGDSVDLSELSDREIKEKCINKLRKEVKLDGKSEDYVNARFEIALEDFKPGNSHKKDESNLGKHKLSNDGSDTPSYEEARKKAIARDKELWKAKA